MRVQLTWSLYLITLRRPISLLHTSGRTRSRTFTFRIRHVLQPVLLFLWERLGSALDALGSDVCIRAADGWWMLEDSGQTWSFNSLRRVRMQGHGRTHLFTPHTGIVLRRSWPTKTSAKRLASYVTTLSSLTKESIRHIDIAICCTVSS